MQALMWMIFRSREWVNEAAEENEIYRTYHQELILPSGEKRLVEERADPCNSLHILLHINSEISQGNTPYYNGFNEAWVVFTQKCQEGKIEVIALKNNQGEYVQIPSIEFIRLKPFTDNSGRTYLEADRGLGFSTRWHDAMIERDSVLKIWPEIITKNFSAPASLEKHLEEYRKYHNARKPLYLEGRIATLWDNQNKEENMISDILKEGFDRTKYRNARSSTLAQYPSAKKTRFSKIDHETLKSFLRQQNS